MLRIGLTGGLGSGKTTVAGILRRNGAHVIQADEVAREMMQPGQPVFEAIVSHFGSEVLTPAGALDRAALTRVAFQGGRLEELNGIIHPPVIAAQHHWMNELFVKDPHAIAVVESALIFETNFGTGQLDRRRTAARTTSSKPGPGSSKDADALNDGVPGKSQRWHDRFDKIILVTAPDELKVARFVHRLTKLQSHPPSEQERAEFAADARRRLAAQLPDEEKARLCDYVLNNTGSLDDLSEAVTRIWNELTSLA